MSGAPGLDRLPSRTLPVLYFATAHVSLALAFACIVWDPRAVAGFFYHSWMVAIVHLVTLGWITLSILGASYIVAPMALEASLPVRRRDHLAFWVIVIGIIGMVSHFWIQEFGGMAWSAAMVTAGLLVVMWRFARAVGRTRVAAGVRLHVLFAAVNLTLAAVMGTLIGFDKVHHFLPGYVLSNVFAHAHLAAVGFAVMLTVGLGYRLMPMLLPAAMPRGAGIVAGALLLEAGVIGLVLSILFRAAWTGVFASAIVAGLLVFVAHVGWMLRHPRRRAVSLPAPDYGVLHVFTAVASLVVAAGLGLWLAIAPTSSESLRLAVVYGVLGLVGFLAQMVIGVQARLLAMFAWYQAMARTAPQPPTLAPGEMPDRTLQAIGLVLWIGGVPLLAAGFYLDAGRLLSAGAWCLFCATGVSAINAAIVLRHAFPPQASQVIRRLRRLRRLVGGAEACKHETARGDASGPGSARILAFVTADKSSTVVLPDNRCSHPGPLPDSRHGHRLNQRHRRISAGDVVAQ